MALITENCPLVALIKSYCARGRSLLLKLGEQNVGFLAIDALSCLPVRFVQQMVTWFWEICKWLNRSSPVLTNVWQTVRPDPGSCGASLVLIGCYVRKSVAKTKGLNFALDDVKCCNGEWSVFSTWCSETLLQLYSLKRRLPRSFPVPQYF